MVVVTVPQAVATTPARVAAALAGAFVAVGSLVTPTAAADVVAAHATSSVVVHHAEEVGLLP